jgi:hypothetical protein
MKHTNYATELCLPYKGAVTHHEEMVTDIATSSCDHSNHYGSSEVTAL